MNFCLFALVHIESFGDNDLPFQIQGTLGNKRMLFLGEGFFAKNLSDSSQTGSAVRVEFVQLAVHSVAENWQRKGFWSAFFLKTGSLVENWRLANR